MMLKLEDIRSNAGMATGADVDIAGLEIISDRSDASSISSTASSHQQLTSTAVNTDAARPLTPEIIDEPLKNLSISETSSPKRKRRGPPPNRLQSLPSVPSRSINGANSSQHSSTSTNSFPSDGLLTPAQKNALQSLSSMFPAYTASELERVAKPHHFDVQKTADTILRNGIPSELSSKSSGPSTPWSSVASGSESARENDPVIVELRRLFPDAYHEDVYHAAVDGEWNTEKAASVLLDLMEKRKANSKYVVMGTTIVSGTNYSWSEPPRGAPVKSRIRSEGRKPQHDPQYCREMAAMVHEKRRDLFIKAANAFSKGNLTGKGAASYFAQEAQKLASEVQEWNRLAAQGIIEEHRKRVRDPNVIDVHHLTVAEALEYVLEELQQWDRRRRLDMAAGGQVGIAAATTPFVIITGTGRHREAGVGSKLYSAIARRLVVDGWKVRKDHNQDKLFIVGRTF
ncbi:hypothetical protein BJ742DRAFT_823096 [Cladochytrium replicatum]|nr:hypothetical protein BJ742DRAFT_823096 [Cladochytrium replicatum]